MAYSFPWSEWVIETSNHQHTQHGQKGWPVCAAILPVFCPRTILSRFDCFPAQFCGSSKHAMLQTIKVWANQPFRIHDFLFIMKQQIPSSQVCINSILRYLGYLQNDKMNYAVIAKVTLLFAFFIRHILTLFVLSLVSYVSCLQTRLFVNTRQSVCHWLHPMPSKILQFNFLIFPYQCCSASLGKACYVVECLLTPPHHYAVIDASCGPLFPDRSINTQVFMICLSP